MITFLKQFFCVHPSITTTTESTSPEHIFIVKSLIQCDRCKKTFPQHPHAECCHVKHIHSQLMMEYWINKVRFSQQQKEVTQ